MRTFNFTLILEGPALEHEDLDRLYEAGCDDAIFGVRDQLQYAEFDRSAPTLATALVNAILDIETTVSTLRVVRVEPDDLVTGATIAERSGRSRQNIRQLATGERGPGDFPAPVSWLDGRSRVWQWSQVAEWFKSHLGQDVAPGGGAAQYVAALNGVLEVRKQMAMLTEVATEEVPERLAFTEDMLRALPAMVVKSPAAVRRSLTTV
jgi:hypothetical protein